MTLLFRPQTFSAEKFKAIGMKMGRFGIFQCAIGRKMIDFAYAYLLKSPTTKSYFKRLAFRHLVKMGKIASHVDSQRFKSTIQIIFFQLDVASISCG